MYICVAVEKKEGRRRWYAQTKGTFGGYGGSLARM
jgi:hypothetical protein